METRLIVLKRLLDALAVPVDIGSIEARKKIQKAVYLAQSSGVKLGYAYGWYLLGPYSTSLARDYYALSSAVTSGESADGELRDDVQEKLQPVRSALSVPEGVSLAEPAWFELVSSVHFLRTVRGLDQAATVGVLQDKKPDLAPYADSAEKALSDAQLL